MKRRSKQGGSLSLSVQKVIVINIVDKRHVFLGESVCPPMCTLVFSSASSHNKCYNMARPDSSHITKDMRPYPRGAHEH